MRHGGLNRQRGAALIAALAIVVLALAYLLVSRVNNASGYVAIDRDRNGAVLNRAKQALVGYVAQRAATAGEDDPGRLPCPEAPASFGGPNEGIAASVCSLPAVGRLPWRTLGLDKLVDANAEPLWYVVSPGWALPNSTAHTLINSNSIGQLTVNGIANDSVALIIAPGAPTTSTCTGSTQARTTAGAPDKCNYLEDVNSAGAAFVTTSTASGFNDQVVKVTTAELLPEIEAAIATRIEREIVPLLKAVYANSGWGTNISAGNPVYPFPTAFADPSSTTSYRGAASSCSGNVCQGLLPVNFSNDSNGVPCTVTAGSPCDPNFVAWASSPAPTVTQTGGLTLASSTCSTSTVSVAAPLGQTSQVSCNLTAWSLLGLGGTMNIRLSARANNVGMAMRTFNTAPTLTNATLIAPTPTATLNSDGSATVTVNAQVDMGSGGGLGSVVSNLLCGITGILGLFFECRSVTVTMPMASNTAGSSVFPDHPILDASDPTTGWFMRNEWYRVLYYGAARTETPSALPGTPSCTAGTDCLVVNNLAPANNKRSILMLAGRSLAGTVGANRGLNDFLDTTENRNGDRTFEKVPVGAQSNDRIVVVDTN